VRLIGGQAAEILFRDDLTIPQNDKSVDAVLLDELSDTQTLASTFLISNWLNSSIGIGFLFRVRIGPTPRLIL
jgi:hypothetical protein